MIDAALIDELHKVAEQMKHVALHASTPPEQMLRQICLGLAAMLAAQELLMLEQLDPLTVPVEIQR